MSEPLEFREEAHKVHLSLYELEFDDPAVATIIDRALREAAAKALDWAMDQGVCDGLDHSSLREMISALRTPSAPNANR